MTICLSENLKRLRQEKGVTQENLADYLGVSFQSISNWERSESYPDITLLPMIALYFGVTVDEVLGMNKAKAQKKIQEYLEFYETMRYKDTHLTYEKFCDAVKEFPSDFRIAVRYMELLVCEKTDKDLADYEKTSHELMAIYENIQNRCTDDSIRMWAKRLICQHLHTKSHYTGNEAFQELAEAILSEMPDFINTRDYLSTMLISDKDKQNDACSSAIEMLIFLLEHSVDHYCLYDDSFSAEYKIGAIKKMLQIYNIIYTDNIYGKSWLDVIYNYGHLGYLYYVSGDNFNALQNLRKCAELSKEYDNLPENLLRSSQFFENRVFTKTERGKSMCERMKYLMTEKYPLSDGFRESTEFKEIISALK